MRSGFLSGARRLWALRAFSRTAPPPEELFAREGPLRAFLERRAGSEAGALDAGEPQLAAAARLLSEKERELRDTESLLHDENEELKKLAESEIALCQKEITQLKHQIISLLVPPEETDESDLILEVTAGVGGQEAMLFTSEMFDMYQQYAAFKRWHFETLEYFPSELVYSTMKGHQGRSSWMWRQELKHRHGGKLLTLVPSGCLACFYYTPKTIAQG